MRTTLLSLGLGLILAAPAFAAEAPKTAAPAPAVTDGAKPVKKVRHHKHTVSAIADGEKTGDAKPAGDAKKKPTKKVPKEKPADPAPAK